MEDGSADRTTRVPLRALTGATEEAAAFAGDPYFGLHAGAHVDERSFDLMSGERQWVTLSEGEEAQVDASIAKQKSFDPDLWVIEVEDARGRHMLGDEGLD